MTAKWGYTFVFLWLPNIFDWSKCKNKIKLFCQNGLIELIKCTIGYPCFNFAYFTVRTQGEFKTLRVDVQYHSLTLGLGNTRGEILWLSKYFAF